MFVRQLPFGAIAAAALLSACSPGGGAKAPVATSKIIDAIKSNEVNWNADWRSGDANKLAAHYAPDAMLMTPGAPTASGSPAIKATLSELIGRPGFGLVFVSDRVDVATSGDLATTRGTYKQTTDAGEETGSFVTVYRPGPDGAWKAVLDINTPSK